MSVKQLSIFCAVVAVFVAGVTFVKLYLGEQKPVVNGPQPGAKVQLHFPETEAKPTESGPPMYELQAPGHYDFWFENQSGVPLQLGLRKLGCKCSKVEVLVLGEEQWKSVPPEQRETLKKGEWKPLPEQPQEQEGVAIPAGAAGWARLGWRSEAARLENLSPILWARGSSGESQVINLRAQVLIVEPVFCIEEESARDPAKGASGQSEKLLGKLGPGDRGEARFLCWSATRPNFKITPEPSKSPCITVGAPEKLNEVQCKEWSDRFKMPVLCAYTINVSVVEQADEKNQLDMGLFRYGIRLKTDANDHTADVFVLGEVEGPVRVSTEDNLGRSRIDLGHFSNRDNLKFPIRVATTEADMDLKVDRQRTDATPFFQVKDPVARGAKNWEIELTIPAGTVEGPFPDRSKEPKPGHQDCAVYLLVRKKPGPGANAEEPWRRIRIPILGNATR